MNNLIEQLSKYITFKDYLSKILESINGAIKNLDTPKDLVENYFSIDDYRADNNELNNVYEDLMMQKNFLVNTCIPSVDEKIDEIEKAIEEERSRMLLSS